MTTIPYSATPEYTTVVHDNDIFIIEQNGAGFAGMKKITVADFLQPVYDEIGHSISAIYKFMGSVQTYEDLPVYVGEQTPVPVWGILTGAHAGENFAWITDHWEPFNTEIDLSDYVTEEELAEVLAQKAPARHTHTASDITDLNVIQSMTLVSSSSEDGGTNVFSVQKTNGSTQEFTIRNGNAGKSSINYRIDGTGSITKNLDGSYSPAYLYLQSQRLSDTIEAYAGRILISSMHNNEWTTVYPASSSAWTDETFLQFYIPADTTLLRIRLYPVGTDYSEITDNNFLCEENVSVAVAGPRGYSSKIVEMKADSYVFKTDVDGVIREPDRVNFTVNLQNTENTPVWVVSSMGQTVKTGTSLTFSITATEMAPYDYINVNVICDGLSDTCTVVKVSDGSDGTSPKHVICDNESFNIPVDSKRITSSAFTTVSQFTGYAGSEEVECVVLDVSDVPRGMSCSVEANTVTLSIPVSTPLQTDFGDISVIVSCAGTLMTKKINWSVSKEGRSVQYLSVEADSYVFRADSSGSAVSPQEITFTATLQNLTSTPVWTARSGDTLIKSGNGLVFKLTAAEMSTHSSVRVRCTCEDCSDSSTVVLLSDGQSGYSTVQVRLLKRANSTPRRFRGDTATYTFATGALSFGPEGQDGWSTLVPSGSGYLYAIYASAHSQGATDTISPNEWTDPVILSEESVIGQSGYNTATVFIYARGVSKPSVPSGEVSYRFAGGEISGLTSPWSKNIPSGSDDLWVSQATAFSRSDSDVIASSEWTDPVIMSYNSQAYNTAQVFLYKRSASLPEAYAGSTAHYDFSNATISFDASDDGWSITPPVASGNLYIICVAVSSHDDLVDILPSQWTTPQLYVMEPENGASGYNSATVFIYARSASSPQTPQNNTVYSFETGSLSGLTSNWSQTPPAGETDLWVSQTVVTGNDTTATILPRKWASPVIIASNGASGSNGWSSAQVLLYKRAQSKPAAYAGSSVTYTFSTGAVEFAGGDDGWSPVPPDGSDNLYIIRAAVASQEATDVIGANEWSEPTLYSAKAVDGAAGQNGYNTATVFIYRRSPIEPALPDYDVTYYFADGTIVGLQDGWSEFIPEGAEQVWVTQATAFSRSTSDVIESSQWVQPVVMAKNGENGRDGYNIVCTNETFNIPTDADGRVTEAFTVEVSFLGYYGSEERSVVLSDLRGVPAGMNATINGNVLTILVFENVLVETDYGVLSVTATCDDISFPKYVTWSKSRRGQPGEKGDGNNWYQGTILTGESICSGFAGKVGDCYLNTDTCNVYKCIVEGDATTAEWRFELNIKGDEGQSFTVVIESSNGNIVKFQDPFVITLSCRVYRNVEEVTSLMDDWRFRWTRNSGNPTEDERWNSQSKAVGHKQIIITNDDTLGRSVFNCEVDLDNFRNI